MKKAGDYTKLIIWVMRRIRTKQLVLILSVVVGVFGGLAAVILKTLVHEMEVLLTSGGAEESQNYMYLAYPVIGIFLTVLFLKYVIRDEIGHGISRILYAISKKKSIIRAHNMYSSIIACTFTGGFGGSVGMEAPIVYTGSSIGSNIGRIFRMPYKTKTLLVACGAAAAVSGIFKAPVAGVIFTLEILMIDLTTASILPLLIASVSGSVISNLLLGKQIIFYFSVKDPFVMSNLPFYVLLGLFAGLISWYFTAVTSTIESRFRKIKNVYLKLAVGGVALGVLIFLFPPLYGEGYMGMKALLSGSPSELLNNSIFFNYKSDTWAFLFFLLMIMLYKVVATSITTGSGGVGGIFAPAMFMGAVSGFIFSRFVNTVTSFNLSESNFTLVGIAGVLSGTLHAPLTAIFLIAEITNGYGLFMPLMVTSALAYFAIKLVEPHSLYAKRLALRGELITHHKDKSVLAQLDLVKLIEKGFIPVQHNANLGDLVKIVKQSNRNIFPVLNYEGVLVGVVTLDEIREIMFDRENYTKSYVVDLMIQAPDYIYTDDTMEAVVEKFNKTASWNLPVVENDGTYVGFISRAHLFSVYRKLLVEFSEE
ncbi:MAG: chloride channel protein [Bacteroidetes bacterium]|nr:chloride channel protein [Bacteroidota bacterium]MBU1720084.1 chloride channel protein [Bacteroidota bacterium]